MELEMTSLHKQRCGNRLDFWDNVNLRRLYKRTFLALRLRPSTTNANTRLHCKLNIVTLLGNASSSASSSSSSSSSCPLLPSAFDVQNHHNHRNGNNAPDEVSTIAVTRVFWADGSTTPLVYGPQRSPSLGWSSYSGNGNGNGEADGTRTPLNRQVEFVLCPGQPVVLELNAQYCAPKKGKKPRFMFQLIADDRLVTSWCSLVLHRSGSCGAMGRTNYSTGSLFRLDSSRSSSPSWSLVGHPVAQHTNEHPLLSATPARSLAETSPSSSPPPSEDGDDGSSSGRRSSTSSSSSTSSGVFSSSSSSSSSSSQDAYPGRGGSANTRAMEELTREGLDEVSRILFEEPQHDQQHQPHFYDEPQPHFYDQQYPQHYQAQFRDATTLMAKPSFSSSSLGEIFAAPFPLCGGDNTFAQTPHDVNQSDALSLSFSFFPTPALSRV